MKKTQLWRDDGFTLVELVVAMVIIGIVMVSIITVQLRAMSTNAETAARNTATALANTAMEELRTLPWNVLRKGMASSYDSVGGGDALVDGNVLTVNGGSYDVVVAPSGASDQDISIAREPLFDTTGSNRQTVIDPQGSGETFIVHAYVTENIAEDDGAIGLAVVVEWPKRTTGGVGYTTVFSIAYAPTGGCGDLDTAPFLSSCQPTFSASSSTASISSSVGFLDGGSLTSVAIGPGSSSKGLGFTLAQGRASVTSSQYSSTAGQVEFAVSYSEPTGSSAEPTIRGGSGLVAQASDNAADPNAPGPHAGISTGYGSDTELWATGSTAVGVEGDEGRQGTVNASTTQQCSVATGRTIPAGQPCATGRVASSSGASPWAAWQFTDAASNVHTLSLASVGSTSSSGAVAFAGRFEQGGTAGNSNIGCSALGGAGCVSAGTISTLPSVTVGNAMSFDWVGNAAPNGLVTVSGYSDSTLVQRGTAQATDTGTTARSATISYWNGSSYSSASVSPSSDTEISTGTVTYVDAAFTISTEASISVGPVATSASGSDCSVDACKIEMDAGSIIVTMLVTVTPASGDPYVIESTTVVSGSYASARFTEPVD